MDALDEQITLVSEHAITAREQTVFFDAVSKASKLAKDNFTLQFQPSPKEHSLASTSDATLQRD